MLWIPLDTVEAMQLFETVRKEAVRIAKDRLKLGTYEVREIRYEDFGLTDFSIVVTGSETYKRLYRRVLTDCALIFAGMSVYDTLLKYLYLYKGTDVEAIIPLLPVYQLGEKAGVFKAFKVYGPTDIIDARFYATATSTDDQTSRDWLIGVSICPPGTPSITQSVASS